MVTFFFRASKTYFLKIFFQNAHWREAFLLPSLQTQISQDEQSQCSHQEESWNVLAGGRETDWHLCQDWRTSQQRWCRGCQDCDCYQCHSWSWSYHSNPDTTVHTMKNILAIFKCSEWVPFVIFSIGRELHKVAAGLFFSRKTSKEKTILDTYHFSSTKLDLKTLGELYVEYVNFINIRI